MLRDWLDTGHHDVKSKRGFMGKTWDAFVPQPAQWKECLRVIKPGGHLLAFAGTRTQDLMVLGLRIAGFEIRDLIAWVYGSGFPKSHNLSGEWDGWGTALKPALEPITLARKPLTGTVAQNVLAHGVGAINIDGCRVGIGGGTTKGSKPSGSGKGIYGAGLHGACEITQLNAGRWPANLIHDGSDEVLAGFPSSVSSDGIPINTSARPATVAKGAEKARSSMRRVDAGSNARFFYCAKTSKADRNEGCDNLPDKEWAADGAAIPERSNRPFNPSKNNHSTVKPTELMRYLCRLVTPPGGTILDPWMGSGSTGKAAKLEGFDFIGMEQDKGYFKIACARCGVEHFNEEDFWG